MVGERTLRGTCPLLSNLYLAPQTPSDVQIHPNVFAIRIGGPAKIWPFEGWMAYFTSHFALSPLGWKWL